MALTKDLGHNSAVTIGSTLTITLSDSAISGHRVALVEGNNSTQTVSTVTDSRSNTWTRDVHLLHQGNSPVSNAEIWSTVQNTALLQSGDTITITLSASNPGARGAIVFDLAAGDLDKTASNYGSTATMDSGTTTTTTHSNEVAVVGYVNGVNDSTWTAPTGWTKPTENLLSFGANGRTIMVAYKELYAEGTVNGEATSDSASNWTGLVATYDALGSGASKSIPVAQANGVATASGSVVKSGSSVTRTITPAQSNGAGSILAPAAASGVGSGFVFFSQVLSLASATGSGSGTGTVSIITTPTGGTTTKLINPDSPMGLGTASGDMDNRGSNSLINLNVSEVAHVSLSRNESNNFQKRVTSKQPYFDRYETLLNPPDAYDSSLGSDGLPPTVRWVVWDNARNEIVSVHASSDEAQDALFRRWKRIPYEQGLNLSVESIDG